MEITKHNFKLAKVTKDIEDIYYKEVLPNMFTNKTFYEYNLLNGREKYRNVFRYSDSNPGICLMWFKVNPKSFKQPDYVLCTYSLSFD